MPTDENTYRSLTDGEKLKWFVSESAHFMSAIIGYSQLLKYESQKPELVDSIPPEFLEYYDAIEKYVQGWMNERDALIRSMSQLPSDTE